ncbi:putative NAD-dependent epimerase/dehydratase, NAD(P)-binding domain superfamily [Dioscorea sansibarensis]
MQLYCIVVLGGSGFVGTAICKAAVSKGIKVVSLSRSGRPSYSDSWVDQVTWVAGVPKFILITVHDYNLLSFLLSSSYFTGKRKAKYPSSVQVSYMAKRKVDGFEIPLHLIGEPLEKLLSATENFANPLSSLPTSDLPLIPPMSVDDVPFAVLNAVLDDIFFGVFTIEQIKKAAAKLRI